MTSESRPQTSAKWVLKAITNFKKIVTFKKISELLHNISYLDIFDVEFSFHIVSVLNLSVQKAKRNKLGAVLEFQYKKCDGIIKKVVMNSSAQKRF